MQTRTLFSVVLTVLFLLACGGAPIKIQVGDAKLEVGTDEDVSAAPSGG